MMQGTTPRHIFRLPFSVDLIDKLWITYAQDGKEVMTLTKEQCRLFGQVVERTLSQKETLGFQHDKVIKVQLRVLTLGGEALQSKPRIITCEEALKKEVLE